MLVPTKAICCAFFEVLFHGVATLLDERVATVICTLMSASYVLGIPCAIGLKDVIRVNSHNKTTTVVEAYSS